LLIRRGEKNTKTKIHNKQNKKEQRLKKINIKKTIREEYKLIIILLLSIKKKIQIINDVIM